MSNVSMHHIGIHRRSTIQNAKPFDAGMRCSRTWTNWHGMPWWRITGAYPTVITYQSRGNYLRDRCQRSRYIRPRASANIARSVAVKSRRGQIAGCIAAAVALMLLPADKGTNTGAVTGKIKNKCAVCAVALDYRCHAGACDRKPGEVEI